MSLKVIQGPFTDKALLSEAMKIYTKRESERKIAVWILFHILSIAISPL